MAAAVPLVLGASAACGQEYPTRFIKIVTAASGLPGYESVGMTGIFAVGDKTPRPIIARLNQEILKYLARPEIKEQFLKSGVEMVGSTPEQFAEAIRSDIAKMGKLIKDIDLRVE